jgi:purine nucleosidase
MPNDTVPVLLDTDIGSDVDDAVCLAYLLKQRRCELVGVTTVTGDPQTRAMLVDAICRAAGRPDIPIQSGAESPILLKQRQKAICQQGVLAKWAHRSDFKANQAVDFLRETIRSRPGELTLVGVGPLTNIGLLFALDPEIPRLLRSLVLMAGEFTLGKPDWNAEVDPHATVKVYESPVREHVSVGLDITLQCKMHANEARKVFDRTRTDALGIVGEMLELYFIHRQTAQVIFHDPLTAAVVFEPSLCTWREGKAEVYLGRDHIERMNFWSPDGTEKLHRIASSVNIPAFFSHFTETVRPDLA